jgi:REP element-mobilizing transposase RayT
VQRSNGSTCGLRSSTSLTLNSRLLLDVLAVSRQRLKFLLCGYFLMADHWHALVWPGYPLLISDVLHDVKKVSAGKVHARRGSQGPFWRHQFWDRFVRNEQEFGQRPQCMHFNPVRKGLVKRPQDWRWSSYNNFALDKATVAACPIQIDDVRLPEGYRG